MKSKISSKLKSVQPNNYLRFIMNENTERSRIGFSPSINEVSARAYQTFEDQGSIHGNDVNHWLEAEIYLTDNLDK